MIITTEEFKEYVSVYEEDNALVNYYILTAQTMIEDYIGYKILASDYIEYFSGSEDCQLNMRMKPVNHLTEISFNDTAQEISDFKIMGNEIIFYPKGVFPSGLYNILISFNAGYSIETVPEIFKVSCLRISAILFNESNGKIGVSSISDANTGSRSFNIRTFKDYLKPLSNYKKLPY